MSIANASYDRTNFGTSGNVHPRFFMDQVQDMVASEQAGRPIYRDEERVEIIMPGNPHTRPVAKVTSEHRDRWPKEYQAFRDGVEVSPDGTPLEEWPVLRKSQILELKHFGFRTVEHVRDMDDNAVQRVGMGGRRLKELAGIFLDDATRIAETTRLAAENERKDAQIEALTRQIREMGDLMEQRFAELQNLKNAPSELSTNIPGMSDPAELARQAQPTTISTSSLDALASTRRRGRPPKAA